MAKKIKKQIEVTFSLERVITGKFTYELPKNPIDAFEVKYNMTPIITSNIELELVYIRLVVTGNILGTDEQIVSIETLFTFRVQNLKNHVTFQNGQNIFEEAYQPTVLSFISISISTLRGILIEKLNGTILANKIMPVINPNKFLQKTQIDKKP